MKEEKSEEELKRNLSVRVKLSDFKISPLLVGYQPIVAQGKIIYLTKNGAIEAYNKDNFSLLWKNNLFAQSDFKIGGLEYFDGLLYITASLDRVIALDIESGELVWQTKLNKITRSIPKVAGKKLIVQTIDNSIYTLDKDSGQIIWYYQSEGESEQLLTRPEIAHINRTVWFQKDALSILQLDLDKGRLLQIFPLIQQQNANNEWQKLHANLSPISDQRFLYVVGKGTVFKIDTARSSVVWEASVQTQSKLLQSADFIYALTQDEHVVCIDKKSGSIVWETGLPSFASFEIKRRAKEVCRYFTDLVLIAEGRELMIANAAGILVTFDTKSGQLLSKTDAPQNLAHSPILDNGKIYIANTNGTGSVYSENL